MDKFTDEQREELIQDAKDDGRVIDVTCGRKTRAVIITDSEHVILSAIQTETIANRLDSGDEEDEEEEEEEDASGNDHNGTGDPTSEVH